MYLPDPGVKPGSPALQADSLPAGLPGNPSGNGYPFYHSFLLGEFHGQRSLAGYSPWGLKESDTTEQLTHTHTGKEHSFDYMDLYQ